MAFIKDAVAVHKSVIKDGSIIDNAAYPVTKLCVVLDVVFIVVSWNIRSVKEGIKSRKLNDMPF